MVKHKKITALVLSRRNQAEADRLVTFFTREFGLLRVVAYGVRNIPSRRGGHLEPFTQVTANIAVSANFSSLGAVETSDYFSLLHQDHDALLRANIAIHLLLGLFGEEEKHPEIFDGLADNWRVLPTLPLNKRCLLELSTLLLLLRYAGVMPDLTNCQICQRPLGHEAVVLNPTQGGWTCLRCRTRFSNAGLSILPRSLGLLRYLSSHQNKALLISAATKECEPPLLALRQYCQHVGAPAGVTVRQGQN